MGLVTTSSTFKDNKKLASLFRELSECYSYLGNEERFRSRAYLNASKTIDNLEVPIGDYKNYPEKLDELKYIGSSITEKIIEFISTGKIALLDKMKKYIPMDLMKLTTKEGIGPKTIRKLHDTLHINSLYGLKKKIESGKVLEVKGFGKAKIELLNTSLSSTLNDEKRWPLDVVEKISNKIIEVIYKIPGVSEAITAGSIRRKKATIGDIDILIVAEKQCHQAIIESLSLNTMVKRTIAKGMKKATFILKEKDMQLDVRLFEKVEYQTALLYFTGPKEHNITLRSIAKQKGFKLNEYGIYEMDTDKKMQLKSEADIYKLLDCTYQLPENRSGKVWKEN